MQERVLEARNITKKFGGLVANKSVNFELSRGEIHALLGENGAGKTTLCSILYGYLRPDSGEIFVKGRKVRLNSPKDAIRLGIGMVHQDFMLVPNMTVLENLSLLNDSSITKPFVNLSGIRDKVVQMGRSYGLEVNPDSRIEDLSVGERQRVEILKCLYLGADILILDEPTSFLTEIETEKLFRSLRMMKDEGRSIIFVTHKIDEVLDVANRITVLRKGEVVAKVGREEVNERTLASLIIGKETENAVKNQQNNNEGVILKLDDVHALNDLGAEVLKGISLELRKGEILCIAGVAGNGQRELDEVITGMRKVRSGKIILDGVSIENLNPDKIRRLGIAHVCEEHRTGFIFSFSLMENLLLSPFLAEKFRKGIFVDKKILEERVRELMREYNIVASSPYARLSSLSGGNKQKFLLARELFWGPRVIVANNPTKGLDIASANYIRKKLIEARDSGKSVIMISSDIDEVMSIADRIAVINSGRITGVVDQDKADVHELARMMTTLA